LDAAVIARCPLGLHPSRDYCEIEATLPRFPTLLRSTGGVHFFSPLGDGGCLVRGGRGAPAMPLCGAAPAFISRSIVLISPSCASIDCSRSATPIICVRLGRFMLRRYFSM